jgi:hypothetical protein
LESITGFSHLRHTDGGLTLQNNPLLSDVSGLCPWLKLGQVGPGSVLSGNPPGYNSLAQLRAGCDTIALDSKERMNGSISLSISPNPATHHATVDIATTGDYATLDKLELELFDVTGKSCGHWPLHAYSPLVRVDVAHLPEGAYYLTLREGGRVLAARPLLVHRP